jgi:hypothetical protein
MRNVPPPIRRIGAEDSIATITRGSLLKVAKKAPTGPSPGVAVHTIAQGSTPRITKTANRSPHRRNHLRYFPSIVESTSALMIALSMLLIVSKRLKPATINRREMTSTILLARFDPIRKHL